MALVVQEATTEEDAANPTIGKSTNIPTTTVTVDGDIYFESRSDGNVGYGTLSTNSFFTIITSIFIFTTSKCSPV